MTNTLFTMSVESDPVELSMNCLTPELVALTTYKIVKNYWESLGIHPDVNVYAEFDTIVS